MSPPLMLLSARFGYYMKLIRKLHLYLGCLFAPPIIFFSITGAWQTFNFHESSKDKTYTPPAWVSTLSEVHKNQRTEHTQAARPSVPLRWFIVLMSIGLVVTTILGLYMAFKMTRSLLVSGILFAVGIVVPVLLLYL